MPEPQESSVWQYYLSAVGSSSPPDLLPKVAEKGGAVDLAVREVRCNTCVPVITIRCFLEALVAHPALPQGYPKEPSGLGGLTAMSGECLASKTYPFLRGSHGYSGETAGGIPNGTLWKLGSLLMGCRDLLPTATSFFLTQSLSPE